MNLGESTEDIWSEITELLEKLVILSSNYNRRAAIHKKLGLDHLEIKIQRFRVNENPKVKSLLDFNTKMDSHLLFRNRCPPYLCLFLYVYIVGHFL